VSKRKVKLPDEDIIELQENMAFADHMTESLMVQMLHTMNENGIDINEDRMIAHIGFLIEVVRATIYGGLGMGHPMQVIMEQCVDVIIEDNNSARGEIDHAKIDNLVQFIEDVTEDEKDPA
tara:strand:- start:448 stop:810 length:363 start_codon:yes stop_codon:yes gene_type:complete